MQNEEKEKRVFEHRPPNLWNEPSSIKDEHEFKCSANPFKIYIDPRVQDLYNYIESMSVHLKTHQKEIWNNLVNRVVDVFKYLDTEGQEENV